MSDAMYSTEQELFTLLKARYPSPSWALLPQVANGTGASVRRWADAVAFCCYPSLGLEVHGFEIKCHRSDWLRELENGEKSEAVFQFCDRWFVVAAREGIVAAGELPKTWGLVIPKGGKIHTVTAAPLLKPRAFTKTFVASILRNAQEIVTPDAKLKAERRAGYEAGKKEGREERDYGAKRLRGEHDALVKAVQVFERAAGVQFPSVSEWTKDFRDQEAMGVALRLLMSGKHASLRAQLLGLRDAARKISEGIDRELEMAGGEEAVLPKKLTVAD